jgi:hypothetical protein
MRTWLIVSMLACAAVVLAIAVVMHLQLRRFQQRVPELHSDEDLSEFRTLAAGQMYGSLTALVLTWVPLVIWLVGKFVLGELVWLDAGFYVVLPFVIEQLVIGTMASTAKAVRATPATDPGLETQRDHIVDVWLRRLLPDW